MIRMTSSAEAVAENHPNARMMEASTPPNFQNRLAEFGLESGGSVTARLGGVRHGGSVKCEVWRFSSTMPDLRSKFQSKMAEIAGQIDDVGFQGEIADFFLKGDLKIQNLTFDFNYVRL